MRFDRPRLVTFSGIDGAGKSTQIAALELNLWELGFRSRVHTFWDDVVVLSRFREQVSRTAFQGDEGIGSPVRPISRRDKNVKSWYVVFMRLFLYLLDALSLCRFVRKMDQADVDYIIFDRYIYDELANLPLHRGFLRAYVHLVLRLTPRPDAAYLVDADPEVARRRKPEYPLEFLHENRDAYITLSHLIEPMCVIKPGSVERTTLQIMQSISTQHYASVQTQSETLSTPALRSCSTGQNPAKISNR